MSWNQSAAAAPSPAQAFVEDSELFEEWASTLDPDLDFAGEDEAERRQRLDELSRATLSLTVCGDVEDTITVQVPCEVIEEHPGAPALVDGEPEPMAWLIVRVESFEPIDLGSTTLTSFSVAIPGHVGPGLYPLDDLRRRADSDEIEWWGVDDFHLSPSVHGSEATFYLDDEALDGAWVATTGASIAFDMPMVSGVAEVRVTGTITWSEPGDRPDALVQPSFTR